MFERIFKKNKNVVIGAVHLPPLAGYPDYPGLEVAIENALKDVRALEEGGADAIIFENNYDIPHHIKVPPEVADCLMQIGSKIVSATKLPVGISVLWNDYQTALIVSKALSLKFVRVPVFVDTVKTSYGLVEPVADAAVAFRKKVGAEDVALFADIHVKHSEIVSNLTLEESAKLSITKGADALIITGRWTGDAPNLAELVRVRSAVGDFPILCGSGVDESNIKALFSYASGAIVSTSLKEEGSSHVANVKGYDARVETDRVRRLIIDAF